MVGSILALENKMRLFFFFFIIVMNFKTPKNEQSYSSGNYTFHSASPNTHLGS